MLDTRNNLLLFVIANNGIREHAGVVSVITHTHIGSRILSELVGNKGVVMLIQARFHRTRKERWEYLKSKNPCLEEWETELGIKV